MTKLVATIRIGDKIIPMRSPVSNFMYLLHAAFNANVNANVIDTSNTARTIGAYPSYAWVGNASAVQPAYGVSTWGIQVGSNATGVALTDYKLNTQIAHGVGAGELKYSGQNVSTVVTASGANRSFKIFRYFTNDSAGDVTIREVGIVMQPTTTGATPYPVLIARDLTGDIVVTPTNAVPVEIAWQTTA